MDLHPLVIRDGEPDSIRVERQGLDAADAVQRPEHGPRLRVPGGDPARGSPLAPTGREPAAVAAEGEGLEPGSAPPRRFGSPGSRRGARGSRPDGPVGPPSAAVASDRPSGPNATAVTGPVDPRSVATVRPRTTSQTPTTVGSCRVGAASRVPSGLKAKSPRGQSREFVTGSDGSYSTVPSTGRRRPGDRPRASRTRGPGGHRDRTSGHRSGRASPECPGRAGRGPGRRTLIPPIPQPAASSRRPSGLKLRPLTFINPVNRAARSRPSAASNTRTIPSIPPVASRLPSRLKAIDVRSATCSTRNTLSPLVVSQTQSHQPSESLLESHRWRPAGGRRATSRASGRYPVA